MGVQKHILKLKGMQSVVNSEGPLIHTAHYPLCSV